jgi:stage II sporulation protein D
VRALAALLVCLPLAAAPGTLKVRVGQSTIEMPLEEYVAAVLAGESSSFQSDEALKAMAVAARSYGLHFRGRHASEGFDLCATTHCQRVEPGAVTPRLAAAAEQTAGEVLWYEGKPAYTCYSRNCGGVTEDASVVWSDLAAPYLRSHPDPYCTRQGSTSWEWRGAAGEIAAALERAQLKAPAGMTRITIARRTASGRARVLLLGGTGEPVAVAASSFRFAVGRTLGWNTLRSDRYEVSEAGARLTFRGAGEGHGVGLCQRGADQMGREGMGYHDILAFYFPGTAPGMTGRGLAWVRTGGEAVALFSTQPEQDRAVLAIAERQLKDIAGETRFAMRPASRDGWRHTRRGDEWNCSRQACCAARGCWSRRSGTSCCTWWWKDRRRRGYRCGFARESWGIWSGGMAAGRTCRRATCGRPRMRLGHGGLMRRRRSGSRNWCTETERQRCWSGCGRGCRKSDGHLIVPGFLSVLAGLL